MTTALIVDSSRLRGSLLARCFDERPDIRVSVLTTEEAARSIHTFGREFDVIILDHEQPLSHRLELLHDLRGSYPDAKIVIAGVPSCATPRAADVILHYFEYGASGYVGADEAHDRLVAVVDEVTRGEARIHPPVATGLIARVAELRQMLESSDPTMFDGEPVKLTPRQQEVLGLIASGLSNQEIADRLFISTGTVKNHVHSILESLHVPSREHAVECYNMMQQAEPAIA